MSYRTILRSSLIIGGAQVANVLAGILRMKAAAVILGPAGVGLAGLYANVIQVAAAVSGLGLGAASTRQIAAANADGGAVAVGIVRRALFWGTLGLAVVGALLFWLFSERIAVFVLNDPARAGEVAWLAVGVALTVAAGSQAALLTGLRRVGDLARINVGAGILGTILGVGALWLWGERGLLAMVLVAPAATFVLGHLYVRRLGPPAGSRPPLPVLVREWRAMVGLGLPLMLAGLVTLVGHLAVRTLVQQELGAEGLGQFQAAWVIGMTYIGFILGAMGTDYYPRLTAAIGNHEEARRLVNEQTEVALLLCAPVLVAMLGLAPWVIRLLYTDAFAPAVGVLRWQLVGDILKVMSWPLGFVILARGMGKTFIFTEATGIGVFVLGVALGLPALGVQGTGVAFLALYVVYLLAVFMVARRTIAFRWSRAVAAQAGVVIAAAVGVELAARSSEAMGAAAGLTLSLLLGLWALIRLSEKTEATGKLASLGQMGKRLRTWMTRK